MTDSISYSFVSKKDCFNNKKLELLQTKHENTTTPPAVSFKVIKGSMTANNKFYWSFGEKPPFNFNKCYPVDDKASTLVDNKDTPIGNDYMSPVVWGIAEITSTTIEGVEVGAQYLGLLPIGDSVSFAKASLKKEDGSIVVDRPSTFAAYNSFNKIESDTAMSTSCEYSDLALVCFPGIVTGHGLYFRMLEQNCYGADSIVVTSASSKVALAMALYMKNDPDKKFENTPIIGYTSKNNMQFCEQTGLYDSLFCYDDILPSGKKYVVVDIAGRADVYTRNKNEEGVDIIKLLVVGNASGIEDKKGMFTAFTTYAKMKMIMGMMGIPPRLHSWMPKPTQELYLIWEDMAAMEKKWGKDKLKEIQKESSFTFCKAAKKWMSIREAKTDEEIGKAFIDILEGSVPPSEIIALDICQAVADRK